MKSFVTYNELSIAVLKRTRELLERGQSKRYTARTAEGKICSMWHPDAHFYSIDSAAALAVDELVPKRYNAFLVYDEIFDLMNHIALVDFSFANLNYFNDHETTSTEKVLKFIDNCIKEI